MGSSLHYSYDEPGRVSVWSLQSDGFVSIGNVSSYGCAAFRCSEFVCVPARAHSLHLSPFACFPLSVCLCVRQQIIHDLEIHPFD